MLAAEIFKGFRAQGLGVLESRVFGTYGFRVSAGTRFRGLGVLESRVFGAYGLRVSVGTRFRGLGVLESRVFGVGTRPTGRAFLAAIAAAAPEASRPGPFRSRALGALECG